MLPPGPRPVLDDHGLSESSGEALRDGARQGVGHGAGLKRHDDADRLGRILRERP